MRKNYTPRFLPLATVVFLTIAAFSVSQKANAQCADLSFGAGCTAVSIDFTGFAGAGFSPNPAAGQLCSNHWAVTGWSNGALAFGGTQTTANTDYTRGNTAAGNITTGGIYSLNNGALYIQPGGGDWAPGTITLRVQNNTGEKITSVDVAFDMLVRNDQARSSSFNFSYSSDNAAYTAVPALDYTSPTTADGAPISIVTTPRMTTISGLNIAPGDYVYLRWSGADAGGSGSRDEFGLDNISLTPTCVPICDISSVTFSNVSVCNNNGTTADATDDYYTADVTVVFVNAPGTGSMSITGADALTGGGALSVSAVGLTSPYTFVGVRFKADGSTTDGSVAFSDDTDCALGFSEAASGPCSTVPVCSMTCPGPLSVSCTSNVPAPDPASVTTSSCSGGAVYALPDVITLQTCANRYTLTRTYSYAASQALAASSTSTCTQIITVNDQTAPIFNGTLPGNMNIGCTDPLPLPEQLTGTDACGGGVVPSVIWINELHYDNSGTDAGEFVEVAGTAGINLADYQLYLYNGNGGVVYGTPINLSGNIDNEGAGFGAVSFLVPGLQNGGSAATPEADGMALYQISTGMVIQFISYEGVMQANGGPADGMTSVNIGVSQEPAPAAGSSLLLSGSGSVATDFTWSATTTATAGTLNPGQTITALPASIAATFSQSMLPGTCPGARIINRTWTLTDACGNSVMHHQTINITDTDLPVLTPAPANITLSCNDAVPAAPTVIATDKCDPAGVIAGQAWINEIHYDDAGADMDEFIEVAGRAGIDLNGYELYLYNGAVGQGGTYLPTIALSGVIPDQSNGFGTVSVAYPVNGIQNGAPDGLALVKDGNVIQFLSYEGSFTAVGGPANGMISTDIGVSEDGTQEGLSLRLTGNGTSYSDFIWKGQDTMFVATPGAVNQGQTFPVQPPVGLAVVFSETTVPNPMCAYGRTITRTWMAQDACSNIKTHTQTITINDATPPQITCDTVSVTLGPDGVATLTPANIVFSVNDNCSPTSAITVLPTTANYNCTQSGTTQMFTLSAEDECGNVGTCDVTVTINDEPHCNAEISISDPCVCKNNATNLDNGQFDETVKVISLTGETWTVVAVNGLYQTSSPAPPAAPTPVALGTTMTESPAGSGDYYLYGIHVDALGYSVSVRNATGLTLSIGNSCAYPNPQITSVLDGPFCLYSDPVALTGTPGDANYTSAVFTINGTPATTFDPAMGTGVYTITYTVDGGLPKVVNAADPGCIQSVSTVVTVLATPAAVICNDHVQISLDENCHAEVTPDMVLEGGYGCYDDYEVVITGIGGTSYGHTLSQSNIGQTLTATVRHLVSGNTCWGQIIVEDKLPPVTDCADITVSCAEVDLSPAHLLSLGFTTAYPAVTECSSYTSDFTEIQQDVACTIPAVSGNLTGRILRTWVTTDASGNVGSCTQTIELVGSRVGDVQFPTDRELACGTNVNTTPTGAGSPTIRYVYPSSTVDYALWPDAHACELEAVYNDQILNICDGTYKILRTWTVYDWCLDLTPGVNPRTHLQVIKVSDTNGPAFFATPVYPAPAALTVSTDAYDCCATVNLPSFVVRDNCSRISSALAKITVYEPGTLNVIAVYDTPAQIADFADNNPWSSDTLVNFGTTVCLPIGVHSVQYIITDQCGNVTTSTVNLTVRDQTPPVAICDEWTQVALGANGVVAVNAATFDDGSYDNCEPVRFKVRRMSNNQCDPANSFDDEVKFCCNDQRDTFVVVLRVFDVSVPAGSISLNSADIPFHYNDCMVNVIVEDKLKPVCIPPANVQVSCDNFDPSLWPYGSATVSDNCTVESVDTVVTGTLNTCNIGTLTRRWTVTDAADLTATCQQTITVTPSQYYFVRFPKDEVVTSCTPGNDYGAPEFYGEDCELLATSFVDEVFTVVPDACYKIERTWTVINWCSYNSNTPCTVVPNPDGETHGKVVVSAPGNGINGWAASSMTVTAGSYTGTFNYGVANGGGNHAGFGGWSQNANCYKYKQIIKIIDNAAPTVVSTTVADSCDYTTNDESMWHHMSWWDEAIDSHNLCEGAVNLSITATDACAGENVKVRYQLYLDTDHDGVMETVVPGSVQAPTLYGAVRYNNYQNQNFGGGEIRPFVSAPLAANNFGFGLQTQISGDNLVATVRYVNTANTVQNTAVQLPYGTHKIKWIIEDGCGNEKVHETTFTVRDCKKPTVVCTNGVSVNLMNGPMNTVTLWANDVYEYVNDNCTPEDLLLTKVRVVRADADNGSLPTGISVDFSCADLLPGFSFGTVVVNVYAEDAAGNFDFCAMAVQVQDNMGVCGPVAGMASVAGALISIYNEGIADAQVYVTGMSSVGIPASNYAYSSADGTYHISNAIPLNASAMVSPLLDADPLNGVNTWDLTLISRHILALDPFADPCQLIAADANKSGTVTSFDIVELRKLILGTYTTLPNNTSWRFFDKTQQFTDPQNPFIDVIHEVIALNAVEHDMMHNDFRGVKVGDVDGTAICNSLMVNEERTSGVLLFDVNDRNVAAGETVTVQFKAADKTADYQFTLLHEGLELMEVLPGNGLTLDNFGVFANAITTSANGTDGAFALTFRALRAGQLSQMLTLSNSITRAMSFNADGVKGEVALRFNNAGITNVAGVGFELYQNTPNPFVHQTTIGFYLPSAEKAALTVYDETGRTLYRTEMNGVKGYNNIVLDKSVVPVSGTMYYRVETAQFSATRKMTAAK